MFSGYNLKIKKCFFENKKKSFEEYTEIGKQHLNLQIYNYKNDLNHYVHNGTINVVILTEDICTITKLVTSHLNMSILCFQLRFRK